LNTQAPRCSRSGFVPGRSVVIEAFRRRVAQPRTRQKNDAFKSFEDAREVAMSIPIL